MMVQVILFLVILHADLLAGAACTFAVFALWHVFRRDPDMRVTLRTLSRKQVCLGILPAEALHLPLMIFFIWLAMQACPKRAAIAVAIIMILVSVGRHLLILRHIDDLKRSC